MQKTVRLSEIGEMFSNKRLKKAKSDNWIYDYELRIAFKSEKYRQEFWDAINRAQEDIKRGRVYTQKEMDNYFKEQFGINI